MPRPTTPTRATSRATSRRAFTLAELAVAVFASSVLVLAMGSALSLAAGSLPTAQEPAIRLAEASRALDRLAADTAVASDYQAAIDRSMIQLLIPDRDGDGSPDAILYRLLDIDGVTCLIRRAPTGDRVLARHAVALDAEPITGDYKRRVIRYQLTLAGRPDVTAVTSAELLIPDNTP